MFLDKMHPTPRGHEALARALKELLLERRLLPSERRHSVSSSRMSEGYGLARGEILGLALGGTSSSVALACAVVGTLLADPAIPPAESGFYYLARGRNACGLGGFGEDSAGAGRSSGACP
jgi:hypothetical protein